ncbi:unnamed protein product [Acanthosepion pharaonis]|uniref:Transmembrane protein n=1 Tax=Acanthosepion pharaonis TaxID=158019 RepID=A0A812DYZ0_ACAPH|nr:unnamed protein product [Sepia pharaonis]
MGCCNVLVSLDKKYFFGVSRLQVVHNFLSHCGTIQHEAKRKKHSLLLTLPLSTSVCLSVCLSVSLSLSLCLHLFLFPTLSLQPFLFMSLYSTSLSLSFPPSLFTPVFLFTSLSFHLSLSHHSFFPLLSLSSFPSLLDDFRPRSIIKQNKQIDCRQNKKYYASEPFLLQCE